MKRGWFSRKKAERQDTERYTTTERAVFFDIGLSYLQEGPATVVDVGCGFSDFAQRVQQKNPMAVTHCLDGNPETVETLRARGYNAQTYHVAEKLPFKDGEVQFIHCSHLIEHLQPQELYSLLQEFNRVISDRGVLVISAPVLYEGFYEDLSHLRPYHAPVLDRYLTSTEDGISSTRKHLGQFRREALYHRYQKFPIPERLGLHSEVWVLDLMILALKRIAAKMKIYRLAATGYTAVYRKAPAE